MWHEAEARRGGNEIASCLFKHLNFIESTLTHVILYSDNKNSFVASIFLVFMQNNDHHCIETIDHKFMIPGHSHMECEATMPPLKKKYFNENSGTTRLVSISSFYRKAL